MGDAISTFILLATLWPLVATAKTYECWRQYPIVALIAASLITIAGMLAWIGAFVNGTRVLIWYGRISGSDYHVWVFVIAFFALGFIRYALFSKYDYDSEYARLAEEANRIKGIP